MKSIALLFLTLSINTYATTIEVPVSEVTTLEYKILETQEACALTVDPKWSHEEDTVEARTVLSLESFKDVSDLKSQGFTDYGLKNNEKCSKDNSNTFSYLKNPKPMRDYSDEFFYYSTTGLKLGKIAQEQKAFRTVQRVFIKGVENFKEKVKQSMNKELNTAIEQIK